MIGRPADHSHRLADGEYADEDALECDLALDPEGTMRRREFLARTAAVAGSASFAATMGADQLVAEAARRANRHRLPSPRNLPIDTFVVLMMENRSSYRFGLGHLNRRHKLATNIGRSFNWRNPNFNRPSLPDPNAILATPCILQPGAQPERAKPHDLNDLETSGYLDRLGYEVPEATLDKILRYPDAARRAIAAGNAAGASG